MSVRVTAVDEQTGETKTVTIADGDYLLLAVDPCYLEHTEAQLIGGTHVLTVKGCKPRRKEAAG